MPKWTAPSEGYPEGIEVGDRIVIIVSNERLVFGGPLISRLVILEATENGWYSLDPTYSGYGIEDGCLWATEKSVCEIASTIKESQP